MVALTMKGQSTGEQYYQTCRSANKHSTLPRFAAPGTEVVSISLQKSLEKCWVVLFLFIIIPLVKCIVEVQLARGRWES